jgi:hypothetical protein
VSRARGKATPQKHHIKLHVIPEPAQGTRSVLLREGEGTVVFRADHAPRVVMDCGACDARLVQGVPVSQIENVVLKCNGCGAFNETVEG